MIALCVLLMGFVTPMCEPVPENPPLFVTLYNWELGGVNCDSDCSQTAIGVNTSSDLLNRTAACPIEWLGRRYTTVITLPDGSRWWCIDTFGAQEHRVVWNHPEFGWVYRVDLAVTDVWNHPYAMSFIFVYDRRFMPVSLLLEEGD